MQSLAQEAGKPVVLSVLFLFACVYLCGCGGVYHPDSYSSKDATTRVTNAVRALQEWGERDIQRPTVSRDHKSPSRPTYYVVSVIFMIVIFLSLLIWAMKGMI